MNTSTVEAGTEVAVKAKPADPLTAAKAAVDQTQAEVNDAETALAAAVSDEQSLAAQVRTLEQRIRQGDGDVAPAQLVELDALHRFALLRVEAARDRVTEAKRTHDAATARAFVAEQRRYADTHEKAYVEAFWQAVDALAKLKQLDETRSHAYEAFKAQSEQARRHLVSVGDTDALADLLALPSIEPHAVRGAVIAVAIRKGLGAETSDADWHFVQQLPLRVPLTNLPVLEAGRDR